MDTQDCLAALFRLTLPHVDGIDLPLIDRKRLIIFGGSHGGFISGNMIGQFPHLFRAAVMRNPVLNIPWELGCTDIPDWCYAVLDLPFPPLNEQYIPTQEDYAKMFEVSPIKYIKHVIAPTLLCIGLLDKRVPYAQSIEYSRILKSRNVACRLIAYPDGTHGLADKPSIEGDFCINALLWMDKYSA